MADNNSSSALADTRVVAIDLDGVVYQGNTMITGANAAVSKLRQHGMRVVFATNSSTRTRTEIALKLSRMGIAAEEEDVLTSAYAAGFLVKTLGGRRVLVIGADGLKKEMERSGALVASAPPCDVLVAGMDTGFSYGKLQVAMDAIAGGATFVACNRDASFPGENGRILPGCGPIVAAIEAAVGIPPHHIAGKPHVLMLEIVAARFHVRPTEILVVGDSVESDVAMAKAFGSPSALVSQFPLGTEHRAPRPSCIMRSLAELPLLLNIEPCSLNRD